MRIGGRAPVVQMQLCLTENNIQALWHLPCAASNRLPAYSPETAPPCYTLPLQA